MHEVCTYISLWSTDIQLVWRPSFGGSIMGRTSNCFQILNLFIASILCCSRLFHGFAVLTWPWNKYRRTHPWDILADRCPALLIAHADSTIKRWDLNTNQVAPKLLLLHGRLLILLIHWLLGIFLFVYLYVLILYY